MLASLTHESFAQQANTKFHVLLGESITVPLDMIEVSELKISPLQERFFLLFRGPAEQALGQGTYRFQHDQLGPFDLFIVPIKQDEQGRYYEAAFNRSPKPDR